MTKTLSTAFAHVKTRANGTKSVADVGPLWDPATAISRWTWNRDVSYLAQVWRTALPVWLADMIAVGLSVAITAAIFHLMGDGLALFRLRHVVFWCCGLTGACLLSGLYPATGMTQGAEIRSLIRIIGAGLTLCMTYDVMHGGDNRYLVSWPVMGLMMAALVPLSRALMRRAVCRYRWWGMKAIIVGSGERGLSILRRMKQNPSLGLIPVAMVDRFRPDMMSDDDEMPSGGVFALEDTPELSEHLHAYCGVFAGTEFPVDQRVQLIDALTSVFPQLYITTDSADTGRHWTGILDLGNLRLLRLTEHQLMPGARWVKRAIDLALVLLASPLLLTVVGILALLVKLTSPGPIFYCHTRIGRNGRTIRVWKLRSMVPNADRLLMDYLAANPHLQSDWERLHKLPNDPRVTFIGKILRKTSLDEIPQLWNVFIGEMSLVGPRPIVQAEIAKYQAVYPLYLRVTPGITGLWQVNGRNSTTYEERISYDAEYVRNWSIYLDFYILARTVQTVVTCDGAC